MAGIFIKKIMLQLGVRWMEDILAKGQDLWFVLS